MPVYIYPAKYFAGYLYLPLAATLVAHGDVVPSNSNAAPLSCVQANSRIPRNSRISWILEITSHQTHQTLHSYQKKRE